MSEDEAARGRVEVRAANAPEKRTRSRIQVRAEALVSSAREAETGAVNSIEAHIRSTADWLDDYLPTAVRLMTNWPCELYYNSKQNPTLRDKTYRFMASPLSSPSA